jgi:VRR-NUC domain
MSVHPFARPRHAVLHPTGQPRGRRTAPLTEAGFQEQVVGLAKLLGWRHLHVRRSIGKARRWVTATNVVGWPDLLLWHERQRRVLAAELKADGGKASAEQLFVLASLHRAGIETAIWRPADWPDIEAMLRRRPAEPPEGPFDCGEP